MIITDRLANADLERRMILLAIGTATRAHTREEPSEPTRMHKYDDNRNAISVKRPAPFSGARLRRHRSSRS
jgi:hypothetical protein